MSMEKKKTNKDKRDALLGKYLTASEWKEIPIERWEMNDIKQSKEHLGLTAFLNKLFQIKRT